MKTDVNLRKLLIVDDEQDLCYLLAGMVNRQLDIHITHSLSGGRRELEEYQPDILFLDNQLPDGQGVDWIAGIRKNHPGTKIVMMTSDTNKEVEQKAIGSGADYFLPKPFSRDSVREIIEGFSQRRA